MGRIGCLGGVCLYFLAKALARLANLHRVEQALSPTLRARLQPLFPHLDLSRPRLQDHANLPPNWFRFLTPADGMAFNQRLYFRHTFNENDPRFLRLLLHELFHTEQVRRLGGEIRFACAYGRGYARAGGYWHNPLEVEARAFVAAHFAAL